MTRQQQITREQVHYKIADARRRSREALDRVVDVKSDYEINDIIDECWKAYGDVRVWEMVLVALPK